MAIELAQVAAGFPLAASFAIAGGITALREGRRRASLNEAVHELRRPLQALALSLPADSAAAERLDSSLRLAAAAVEQLEREINGGVSMEAMTLVSPRPLVEAAVERWRARAALAQRPLNLSLRSSELLLRGDEIELSQALDNLISNAIEHGTGEVVVDVEGGGGLLRLAVLDGGSTPPSPRSPRQSLRALIGGRDRHGHGLRVVRRVAARHGGSFQLRRSAEGTEARLELPTIGGAR